MIILKTFRDISYCRFLKLVFILGKGRGVLGREGKLGGGV